MPDNNLGRYVAKQLPEKEFIFNDGFCHVHKSIDPELVKEAKEHHPDALVLAHPECTEDVLELADYIGSTAGNLSSVQRWVYSLNSASRILTRSSIQ